MSRKYRSQAFPVEMRERRVEGCGGAIELG
jgi:hypothetical protein